MSKIKAALVTVLLGSSTAAMASPSLTFSASAHVNLGASVSAPFSGPIVRDHRDAPMPAPVYQPAVYQVPAYSQPANQFTSWISLGSPLQLVRGRDVIRPNLASNITQIRLQADAGMSYIQKVQVRFKDGTVQNVSLNQWLTTRAPMAQFDLTANCRAGIDSITVFGTAQNRNSSYQVFAQGERGTVSYPGPRPIMNVAGFYRSPSGDVTLTQVGNRVHGTYIANGSQGQIDGTLVNGVIQFTWHQPDNSGIGTFTMDGTGHFDGEWGYGQNATNGGAWDLTLAAR